MGIIELLVIAVGVSMDAFAVSVCKGLSVSRVRPAHALKTGLWFGGFQAMMPLIGFFLGMSFADLVSAVDHWIAFVLLALIGADMIKESFDRKDSTSQGCRLLVRHHAGYGSRYKHRCSGYRSVIRIS